MNTQATCPRCDKRVNGQWKVCGYCGYRLCNADHCTPEERAVNQPSFQPIAIPASCHDYYNPRLAAAVIEAVADYDEESISLMFGIVSDWARETVSEN